MLDLTGRQIRDGRMILGWTQRELAVRCQLEFSAVYALEQYDLASEEEVKIICNVLEVNGIVCVDGIVILGSSNKDSAFEGGSSQIEADQGSENHDEEPSNGS